MFLEQQIKDHVTLKSNDAENSTLTSQDLFFNYIILESSYFTLQLVF